MSENLNDSLVLIYIFVDDFLKLSLISIKHSIEPRIYGYKKAPKKPRQLCLAEIVTLGIFRHITGHKNWKQYYRHIRTYHRKEFPSMPNYQNFVATMNAAGPLGLVLSLSLATFFKKQTPKKAAKFVDSTKLEVCKIKRGFSYKVCKGIAKKSKSTMGWFIGFKLHIICNELMQILDLAITPANVDDRKGLKHMWVDIFGLIEADAGYVGKNIQNEALSLQKQLLTGLRANMKKLLTKQQHTLLKLRQCVETIFSVLKTRLGIESTLPRSPLGFFSHYCWSLAAYQFQQLLKIPGNKSLLCS